MAKIDQTENGQAILETEARYQHSWWRIALILFSCISFIIVFTFDTLSGTAASSMYHSI